MKKTNKKKISQITPKKISKPIATNSGEIKITDNLKSKVFPAIVNDLAKALKTLKNGESLRFGKLGSFKKTQRSVNGYTGYQYSFKAFTLLKK